MPVIEQEGGLVVGDTRGQASGSDAAGLPGIVAKHFQQTQADGLAGLALRRGDIEVGSYREMLIAIGMSNPQGEDGTLMPGAEEMLFEEGIDLVEDPGEGLRLVISIFIRRHGAKMREAGYICQG